MPSMMKLDRSRIVARHECEMLRYLNYHAMGKGLSRPVPKVALAVGLAVHAGLDIALQYHDDPEVEKLALDAAGCTYAQEVPYDALVQNSPEHQRWAEQWWLVAGLVMGFIRVRLPGLMEEYEVYRINGVPEIEKEHEIELIPGVTLMLRFDAILRRKSDGLLVIIDYKTLSYLSDDWQKQHEISLQTLLYTWAAAKLFTQEAVAIEYEGLCKGQLRKDTAKSSPFFGTRVQQSPFCYAYYHKTGGVWQTDYTQQKGWEKVALWKHFVRPQEWIGMLEESGKLVELYNTMPPVLPTTLDQEETVAAIVRGEMGFNLKLEDLERNVAMACGWGIPKEEARVREERKLFEQNRGRCYKFGMDNACAMIEYCFNRTCAENPLEDGIYEARTPHHVGE